MKVRFLLPTADGKWRNGTLSIDEGGLWLRTLFHRHWIPLRSVRDVRLEEKKRRLVVKHTEIMPPARAGAKTPFTTFISMDVETLRRLERLLLLRMGIDKFDVYFTHAGVGGVLSLEKNLELERGVLMLSDVALWIVGDNSVKRIEWDDIVNVEEKKRSRYKGTEYSAISIDHFENGDVVSSIVITESDTMSALYRHILELFEAYRVREKLPDVENLILYMIYTGVFGENAAMTLGLSDNELQRHIESLAERGLIEFSGDAARPPKLTKYGIKYVVERSKDGTFGGG